MFPLYTVASESGALILYNFRTANALPKRVFNQPIDWSTKLSDGNIDDIVLIDDVTLSGSQAIDYVGRLPVNNIQTTLMTFFATPIAINNLKKAASQIVPLYVSLLDSRTNLFSDRSSVFSNPDCLQLKDLAFKLSLVLHKKKSWRL